MEPPGVDSPAPTPVDIIDQNLSSCKKWFEKARELEKVPAPRTRYQHHDLAYASSRVALLRALVLRQALIKWQSPNWNMSSTIDIRRRHISFQAQIKLMAKILGEAEPPTVHLVSEDAHPVKATEVLVQYDCSLWLINQLITSINCVIGSDGTTVLSASHQLHNVLRTDLVGEWGKAKVRKIEVSEDVRLASVLQPEQDLFSLIYILFFVCFYSYTAVTIIANSVELCQIHQEVSGICNYIWCLWTCCVIFAQHRRQVRFEETPRAATTNLICRIFAVHHILNYTKQLYVMWCLYTSEGETLDRQMMKAQLYTYQEEVNETIFSRTNNELLPRLILEIQLLLRGIVKTDPETRAFDPTLFLKFTPFTDLHDRVFFDAFITVVGACFVYRNRFRGMHYTFHHPEKNKQVQTYASIIHGAASLLSVYIRLSLFLWKAPLYFALPLFLVRTILVMFFDDTLSFERHFIKAEFASFSSCTTFFERLLYYFTHPVEIRSSVCISLGLRILELCLLSFFTHLVMSETDVPSLSRCFTASFVLFVISEIAACFSCECKEEMLLLE